MKKIMNKIVATAAVAVALTGCIADEPMYSTGEGTVYLSARISSDVQVKSRADIDTLAESCDIWIANPQGVIRKFHGIENVPAEGIRLVSGNYNALVWAGDSVPASWNKRFFKGEQQFTVSNNDRKSVEIVGKIVNTVVAVQFDESVGQALLDYTMTVGHSQGELVYDADVAADAKGYFMMNSRDKGLAYTLRGTLHDGTVYTRTDSIRNCQPATLYTLKVKCTEEPSEIGGAHFTVEVDETTIDHFEDITIDAAPEITGIGFDVNQPQRGEVGNIDKRSLWVRATDTITGLRLECSSFKELLGIGSNAFDFFQMANTDVLNRIKEGGIDYVYAQNDDEDAGNCLPTIKLTFSSTFTDRLPEGRYQIAVTVTDRKGKQGNATLTFIVSDASIETNEPDINSVWTNRALVTVTIAKDGIEDPVVKYRRKGESSWTGEVALAPISRAVYNTGDVVQAEITGLEPATTYEYCASVGDFFGAVYEFTTEEAAQLPNNSFEDWDLTSQKYYQLCLPGQQKFWDSGNEGSTTLGESWNITVPEETMIGSGSKAVALNSKKVITTFAAGNVFAGQFLGTSGTNGILGWGRPFTSRPRQLKVLAHYTPALIDNKQSGSPDEYVKGNPDIGTIYMALLTDYTEEYNGQKWPVVIKTKASERRLFDPYSEKDMPHVIAFGRHDFTEATPGNQLVEVVIDLDYDTFGQNIRPTYILLTASASKGGDYFTGGAGSKLILDDIRLVY